MRKQFLEARNTLNVADVIPQSI